MKPILPRPGAGPASSAGPLSKTWFHEFRTEEIEPPQVDWSKPTRAEEFLPPSGFYLPLGLYASVCRSCKKPTFWKNETIVYPFVSDAPPPHEDLSPEIQKDYNEASSIVNLSPRGAVALLRLCVQKLCVELGQSGADINSAIAALVAKGLDEEVQMALDSLRVIGNNAVHPGKIDVDDKDTALRLFGLLNYIAEEMIARPRARKALYDSLPSTAHDAIKQRDEKSKKP